MVVDHHKPLPSIYVDKFYDLSVLEFDIVDSRGDEAKYEVNFCLFLFV